MTPIDGVGSPNPDVTDQRAERSAAGAAYDAVAARLSRLRKLSSSDRGAAQQDTLAWFLELGHRQRRDRSAALAELAELFRAGQPPTGIDGRTDGLVVGSTIHPLVDRLVAAATTLWMPWVGKQFEAATASGSNTLTGGARWPSKVVWPRYHMRGGPERVSAFDFQTRVEPSAVDEDHKVLVIDYASVWENPRLGISSIRDELVEIVPGAHLGTMLLRRGGRYQLAAYFALRSQPS